MLPEIAKPVQPADALVGIRFTAPGAASHYDLTGRVRRVAKGGAGSSSADGRSSIILGRLLFGLLVATGHDGKRISGQD